LGIPRGGVPVAYEIAKALDGDLDVIVARKLGAPAQPQLALGAVAADGTRYVNEKVRKWAALSDAALANLTEEMRLEAQARERRLRAGMPALDPSGRIVIVTDDGLATGATMRVALESLRTRGAAQLVVAVPVGAADACQRIAREVDVFICLRRPLPFNAVGQHYVSFTQTSDDEVEQLLRAHRERCARSI
jgi:putative phosphoribosyl transferase